MIRCPVCCEAFGGRKDTPEFDAFFEAHQRCKGQTFSCGCEWERLCDGTTLLGRSSDPCPACAIDFPDGSCMMCPGCAECQATPTPVGSSTNPLGLRVEAGLEDDRLLVHLSELERASSTGGLSDGEVRLKETIWRRLDEVTR